MQFNLDGFRPGDPHIAPAAPGAVQHTDAVPSQVDVLIVGCGPAGLTLAAQLAAFPDIHTCIVEHKDGPLQRGQADGIACRTMEMFEAFNFSERVLKEACWINEVTFWKPDEKQPKNIVRHGRVQDTEDGLSEFPHVVLNQARVHDFYLDVMRNAPTRLEPHYARRFVDAVLDPAAADYPVTVTLERTDPANPDRAGQLETVRARYVVGCDGARSGVRKSIGQQLVGDSANQAWGVMDVLAVTDFPDIRYKAAVQSAHGNLLVIPREGGYMVRLYVEMDKLGDEERVASRGISQEQLVAAAQRIFHPFTLDVKEVPWWSVYEIGQRICPRYDDASASPRIFIAGDACHTHSPKAGQGMNFSMQDTFNLGWKLAAVLRGQAAPALLHTYSQERQVVAQELIDFDREWARMFSDRAKEGAGHAGGGESGGVDPKAFQKYFEQHARFTAGMGTHYRPSIIQGEDTHQALATGFTVGMRFHSAPVVRITDAKPVQLGHAGKADGRWRLYAFAGANDTAESGTGVFALCRFLQESPRSPVRCYTRADQDIDAVFDLRAVFQQAHDALAIEAMPTLLHPPKGRYGLRDYEKVFSPDLKTGPDIFDARGIDRARGALVVVRPDQYVAHVLPLDAHEALAEFFAGFMVAA